jgi:hypothetical protein
MNAYDIGKEVWEYIYYYYHHCYYYTTRTT